MRTIMYGVSERDDTIENEGNVALVEDDNRTSIQVECEGGHNTVEVNLVELIGWLRTNRPDLLVAP